MGEFFKPMRRKAGVVTLLLASVFVAGWVRSIHQMDVIIVPGSLTNHVFISGGPSFCFTKMKSWLTNTSLRLPSRYRSYSAMKMR